MDVFGGARTRGAKGVRCQRGFPGKDSSISDFCTWLPNTILIQIQEHEEVSYLLNPKDPEKDLIRDTSYEILYHHKMEISKSTKE